MTDHELLELAAKAAQMPITWIAWPSGKTDACIINGQTSEQYGDGYSVWNPLTDDGDALRLASAIGLTVNFRTGSVYGPLDVVGRRAHTVDRDNIRRAIVRAAAEIGKAM